MPFDLNDPNASWDQLVAQAKLDRDRQWNSRDRFDPFTDGSTAIGDTSAQIYLHQGDNTTPEEMWNTANFNFNNRSDPNQPEDHMTKLFRNPDGSIGRSYYQTKEGFPVGAAMVLAAPFAASMMMAPAGAAGAAGAAEAGLGAAGVEAGSLGSGMYGAFGPSVGEFGLGAGVGELSTGGVLAGLEGGAGIGTIAPSLGGASVAELFGSAYPGAEGLVMGGAEVGSDILGTIANGGSYGISESDIWKRMAEKLGKQGLKSALKQLVTPEQPARAAAGRAPAVPAANTSQYIKPPSTMGALSQWNNQIAIPQVRTPYGNTNLVKPTNGGLVDWNDFN